MKSGEESLFERAAAAGAQLLTVSRSRAVGRDGWAPAYLLVFDVGRVLVRADPATRAVASEFVASSTDVPFALESAAEEEPWWRLLGSPIAGSEEVTGASGERCLRLHFRTAADAPRAVVLSPEGGGLRAALQP